MDGWMDGWTEKRMNGCTDRQTHGTTNIRTDKSDFIGRCLDNTEQPIVIVIAIIIKIKDNDNDNENNTQNKDNKKYYKLFKHRDCVNDHS